MRVQSATQPKRTSLQRHLLTYWILLSILIQNKKSVFVIHKNAGHQYWFKCKSPEEKIEWLDVLKVNQDLAIKNNVVVIGSGIGSSVREDLSKTSPKNNIYSNSKEELKQGKDVNKYLDDKRLNNLGASWPPSNTKFGSSLIESDSPDNLSLNEVINKDDVLESLAKIFYETQMLSNDSPITKELVGVESAASKIHEDLKALFNILDTDKTIKGEDNAPNSQVKVTEAINDVLNLRNCLEKLINNFESIREKLYPAAEKVALIQLEKDPYQIPGGPYK